MSVERSEIETFFGRCRCCLSYGYLKNMWSEHIHEGEAEIYGEMLVQCFALTWDISESAVEQDQICESCISRLRDANDFKKVVLDSQQELVQHIDDEITVKEERLEVEFLEDYKDGSEADTADTAYADTEYTAHTGDTMDSIKDETEYEEIEYLEEDDVDDSNNAIDTDSSQPTDQALPVRRKKKPRQTDTDDDTPKRKWPKKLPKSERHKTYKQYSEEDLRNCLDDVRNNELTPSEASLKYNVPKKTICGKLRMDPKDAQWDKNGLKIEDKDISNAQRNRNIIAKFKENVRSILECTNATPIRGHWGIGYACIYCNYQNPKPSKLKSHTLKTHSENVDEVDNVKYVADMIVKIDITDVKCRLCDLDMDSLDETMNHLKAIHQKPIHFDINNHIVPFKFGTEFLECAVCAKQFDYFKHLSEHMNEHYPNYECVECSRHFINHRAYRTHKIRHKKGVFVCAFCSKIFDTRIKMKEHERVLHLKGSKTRKCGYCDEKFMDAARKAEHEVKQHGAPVPQYACKACGKAFDSQRSLKDHTKHFHLLLRPHTCSECGKGFYNKTEMKRHLVKHTKIKEYQCPICSKFYVTPSCLKGHMKIHDSSRAYTCEICGESFVQKKSLNLHAAKHLSAEVDDEFENADSLDSAENA